MVYVKPFILSFPESLSAAFYRPQQSLNMHFFGNKHSEVRTRGWDTQVGGNPTKEGPEQTLDVAVFHDSMISKKFKRPLCFHSKVVTM